MRKLTITCLLLAVACLTGLSTVKAQPRLPFSLPPKPQPGQPLPSPQEVLAKVIQGLNSSDQGDRLDAAERLGSLRTFGTKPAVTALTKTLNDKSEHVRHASLYALAAIGRDAQTALPVILQKTQDAESEYERVLSAWSAARIASDAQELSELVPMLIKSLASKSAPIRSQATEALVALGRAAHPELIKALPNSDTNARFLLIDVLGRTGARTALSEITAELKSESVALRARAAEALGEIGPAARTAAPTLQQLLASDSRAPVRARAADALGRIGEASDDTIAALAKAANSDKSEVVVCESIESLAELNATEEVLKLMPQLTTEVRPSVVSKLLLAIAQQRDAALPMLQKALHDKNSRYWALLIISDLGPAAKETLPTLTTLLGDKDPLVQREALMALGQLGPAAGDAVPQIAEQLASTDAGVRYAATYAIGQIGAKNAKAIATLNTNVKSEDPFLKMTSAWAAAKIDSSNPLAGFRAMRELATGLASEDANLKQAASKCLADLSPGPEKLPLLLPKLTAMFSSDDAQVRQSAIDALEGMLSGGQVGRVLSAAIRNETTRPLGTLAASRLGPKAKEATTALAGALEDSRPEVRQNAALALAAIGSDSVEAVPALIKRLSDDDVDARLAAVFALGHVGPKASSAVGPLREALSVNATQSLAAWALAHIAPEDSQVGTDAIPQLIKDLDANLVGERQEAALALAKFGSRAATAIPPLKYAADDPDPAVRAAAKKALDAIANK